MPRDEGRVYVGLGSNQGDRAALLARARRELDALPGVSVLRTSRTYESEAIGPVQAPFLNSVVELRTTLEPAALLVALKGIERQLGRTPAARWGPRPIDLDLLSWDGRIVAEPDLQVPHLRLHQRAFALAPLGELCPDSTHPVLGEKLTDLVARLSDQRITPISPEPPL